MSGQPEQPSVDWRAAFVKYAGIVGNEEGVSFLYPSDWTAEEWPEIKKAAEEGGHSWS